MKSIILWLVATLPVVACCQDKTDSTHYTDTVHYHYAYATTGIINSTNAVKSYVLTNALKLSMVKKSAAVNLSSSWMYGKELGLTTNNDFSSTLDLGLYKTLQHFYYWGLAGYSTSVSLKINDQEQAGLGVGYNVVDKKKASLILSDGPLYEHGDLYDSLYGGQGGNVFQRDQYNVIRNSFRLLYHQVFNDLLTLDFTGFFQNAFVAIGDYNLKVSSGLSVKLNKWFSFTTTVTYNKFTRTRSENTLLNFGLTVAR